MYEVWIDNKKFGTTEKESTVNNASPTLNVTSPPTYRTNLNNKTSDTWKRHDDIYQAINWLYDEYEKQMSN